MEDMLQNAKPFKGPSFAQGLKKRSTPAAGEEGKHFGNTNRRRRRRAPAEAVAGDNEHMLPDDTHGWGYSAPPSAVQLEASVVGADTLDQLPVAVRRWRLGMMIPPEESVVIGSASSCGFNMSQGHRSATATESDVRTGHLSPPGYGGGVSGGGAMVLDGGNQATADFGGDNMGKFFPVSNSLEDSMFSLDGSTENMDEGTFLTEALMENSVSPETDEASDGTQKREGQSKGEDGR